MSDSVPLYMPGRFQPPTNHHFRLLRHIEERYGPSRIALGVLPPRERNGANPFTASEVAGMVDDGAAEYDLDVPVDTFVLDEHPLEHRRRMTERLGEPATFYTRERRWAAMGRALAAVDRIAGRSYDINILHEPRDNEMLEPYGDEPYLDSATEVRERLARDDDWHRYVPDQVADRIDADYREAVDACRTAPDRVSGKYDAVARGWDYVSGVLAGDRSDGSRER